MNPEKKKEVIRLSRRKVGKMARARKAASVREMSDVEFLRQSPPEVRAQPLPRREESVSS